ncbi:activator of HSP90 ATPase [Agromyces luteolus]|uniref:SRPBCC domain-containing protein n=1 Tax=Agromyces luteolus TaxID=88373 RepID=A0A7C9LTD5_9MICO|nr:SRPBCC domain-containing protein [Agromyces luteolus]MUN07516.1 SRPBCC domain-containing protein [Agromyces luteolus]GLK29129.1 activator of HSP90 ATPase [Agromyces luteolus]
MTTFDVHVVREFDAPVERVWRAWTEPEDLRAWWGPQGFTGTRAEADVRAGGRILVTMRAPDEWGGFEQHSRWDITEASAPHRLRYVFRFADAEGRAITPADAGIPAGVPESSEHEVVITELADRRARLEMTEHGYATAEARDLSRTGLEQCLDKMAALVADGGADPATRQSASRSA